MSTTTSEIRDASSSLYRIELLKEDNWLPWKRRVTGVLRERRLLKYALVTARETEISEWEDNDARAQTQIELTLSDPQMIHIAGAKTAAEMWTQLKTVKEPRGTMGIIS
ncbi:hypothetical protein GALMADRAFT_69683, partial [Galerina marginata CBS 339.88]